ncbi:MAG: hypothetical protein ACFFFG_12505 [Candidatus Thorarchaeota archaeon]
MSKPQENDDESESSSRLPWIPGLKRPTVVFKIPDIQLPYEAPGKYILGLILVFTIFILAGGIYDLTENPLPMGQTQNALVPIFQSSSEQFLVESLIAAVLFAIGGVGVYLIRHSTRFAYDVRTSTVFLILGIILAIIATFGILMMFNIKTGRA